MKKNKAASKKLSKKHLYKINQCLQEADKYFQCGDLLAAEACCHRALKLSPNHAHAFYILGLIAYQTQQFNTALLLLEKAIACCEQDAAYRIHYAKLLLQQHRFTDAITQMKCVTTQKPEHTEAWYILALSLTKAGDYLEAIKAFETCLKITPNYINALQNLAELTYNLRQFHQASELFQKLLNIAPDHKKNQVNLVKALIKSCDIASAKAFAATTLSSCPNHDEMHWQLANIYQAMQDNLAWHTYMQRNLMQIQDAGIKEKMIIYAAIAAWLTGDITTCRTLIKQSDLNNAIHPQDLDLKNVQAYSTFLTHLLAFYDTNQALYQPQTSQKLYIIGDSHCLSYAGSYQTIGDHTYAVSSFLIVGCKAWHLAQKTENIFKYSVTKAMGNIPEHGDILFTLGEIDCRMDEGFMHVHRKYGNDLETTIATTVADYVAYVKKQFKGRNNHIIFSSVPRINRDLSQCPEHEQTLLFKTVDMFNASLQEQALKHHCSFLDVYHLPQEETMHLDQHHLQPHALSQALLYR